LLGYPYFSPNINETRGLKLWKPLKCGLFINRVLNIFIKEIEILAYLKSERKLKILIRQEIDAWSLNKMATWFILSPSVKTQDKP